MTVPQLGQTVPNFQAVISDTKTIHLSDYQGKNIVLYFYPKDDTPGCTIEAQDFRDNYSAFDKANTIILGISRDSVKSHDKFKCKYELPFTLISDADQGLCNLFQVLKEKNMYGKKVIGIERSTFIIDSKGILRHEWRGVKVPGHVQNVLTKVKEINHG